MKVIFIKYKTLYMILGIILVVIILTSILVIINRNSVETFNINDVFYKGNVSKKIVAFTCNIDWGNEQIPYMLDIFRKNNIKITFFVTGRWAEKNTDLLRQIFHEGHEIGNHGYLHRDYSILSYELNKKEIQRADNAIKKILGVKSKYFAPPAGAYNQHTVRAAKELGYKVIMWSIDTIDWRSDSTCEKIMQRVVKNPQKGDIVLMHPKEETVKALPKIIKILYENGFQIGKVSDVIR